MTRPRTTLTLADANDREQIYRVRHAVYAHELAQHPENPSGRLVDALDAVNVYLLAKRGDQVVGFISVTPPNPRGYSLDKYFTRSETGLVFDDGLCEVRLLTVVPPSRGSDLAFLLMYGALRYCESIGGRQVAAIGRLEVLDVYRRVGFELRGRRVQSGAVAYELMTADVRSLRRHVDDFAGMLDRLEREVDWRVDGTSLRPDDSCYHGGASFEAIGDEFDDLRRADGVIAADVLDAWFAPAPSVVETLGRHLSWALRTSPPTASEGMQRVVARARGVRVENILPGAGSSDLIFAAFTSWMTPASRVLILDPMYGEYAHVLERVIGAGVERLTLRRERSYDLCPDDLRASLDRAPDWIVLVNPNSPTGRHVPTAALARVLSSVPSMTRVWVDETYIDYTGDESLEALAAASQNVIVCKSMSKAYALSGVRAAYLCGPAAMMRELRATCPPWSVSLPGQIAACEALRASGYYRQRWQETTVLRGDLAQALTSLGWDVVPGCANFLLCHLPADGPDADTVVRQARTHGLFLRPVANMGTGLGRHALRVAVKDLVTNRRMYGILLRTLSELDLRRPAPPTDALGCVDRSVTASTHWSQSHASAPPATTSGT